jgi:PIN domain nuclease of toxin-antitoxin system
LRLLLDAHVVLWWLRRDSTLSRLARQAIADAESLVFVSAATVWEIAIKQNIGKLDAPADLLAQLEFHQFDALPITVTHAYTAGFLPRHHDDPFDRMLVAQALAESLTIVTRDPRISRYGVPTLAA